MIERRGHQNQNRQSQLARHRHHRLPESDGSLTEARKMANHADTRTTETLRRRNNTASLREYEKVGI